MSQIPEHTVTNNPHGCIIFGPIGTEDDGSQLNIATTNGHTLHYNKNGNKTIITPKKSEEICGREFTEDRDEGESENVAKAIICENGDLKLHAPNGNLKILAKNIYIEAIGDGNDGSILVKANDHIGVVAGEQMTLGGAKICLTSSDSITMNMKGFLYLACADINKVSFLNPLIDVLIPGPIKELIFGVAQSCR